MNTLSLSRKIHFVGIGGIGVSYLAQWFMARGTKVSGSNLSEEPILPLLRKKGAKIATGPHKASNIPKQTELVIYTLAAPKNNPERKAARRLGIPEMSHAEAVGELTKEKFTISICGTHGKSTTTAMTGLLLEKAGFDPTVFVGTRLKEFGGSNCRVGKSRYLVLEADEWKGAFWHYLPQIAILTNIDREHLDFYGDLRGVKNGFKRFLKNVPSGGIIIANGDDPHARELVIGSGRMHYFYSFKDLETPEVRRILKIPGEHNVSNALAVIALARILRIPRAIAFETVAHYRGAWRRFEYRGALNGAKIFDDYAHHPTEIRATLAAAHHLVENKGKLWCVFQPHQHERLRLLFDDFLRSFDATDQLVLLPTYAVTGREGTAKLRRTSRHLARGIAARGIPTRFTPTFAAAAKVLRRELDAGDICMLMGAGDIVKIHRFLHNT